MQKEINIKLNQGTVNVMGMLAYVSHCAIKCIIHGLGTSTMQTIGVFIKSLSMPLAGLKSNTIIFANL